MLAAFAPDHDALRQSFLGRLSLFSEQFSRCCRRHGGRLILLCLLTPFLWRERDMAVCLSYLCFVCPPSRAVLTVADGFALDIVEVIDGVLAGHEVDAISFFLLYFRVKLIVHRKSNEFSHCHPFMPFEIFSDFGMEVGIDFYGDAFLFIRHCARSFLYIF